jgi:hypothetical protein
MGFADKLKAFTKKTEDAAAAHKDEVHRAVLKAEALADQQTGGQYHDQILKAGQKADAFVGNLKEAEPVAPEPVDPAPSTPPAEPGR